MINLIITKIKILYLYITNYFYKLSIFALALIIYLIAIYTLFIDIIEVLNGVLLYYAPLKFNFITILLINYSTAIKAIVNTPIDDLLIELKNADLSQLNSNNDKNVPISNEINQQRSIDKKENQPLELSAADKKRALHGILMISIFAGVGVACYGAMGGDLKALLIDVVFCAMFGSALPREEAELPIELEPEVRVVKASDLFRAYNRP
jgi:hypothetical protein